MAAIDLSGGGVSIARLIGRAGDAGRACTSAYRAGGMAQLARVLSDAAYWRFHPRVRRWAAELPHQEKIDLEFDATFGVDTAGTLRLEEVGVEQRDVERGHGHYRPVWTRVLREAIGRVPANLSEFTFVDYGSGKGKALLLAADFPFREIIGVEFARPLHEVAVRNIARYSAPTQRCRRLRSECADAVCFEPPGAPLVCFFFNPFDEATMGGVLERLRESARRSPRPIFLIYCNMRDVREYENFFGGRADLVRLVAEDQFLIFRLAGA